MKKKEDKENKNEFQILINKESIQFISKPSLTAFDLFRKIVLVLVGYIDFNQDSFDVEKKDTIAILQQTLKEIALSDGEVVDYICGKKKDYNRKSDMGRIVKDGDDTIFFSPHEYKESGKK